MDPLAALQSRIEQLEARLGVVPTALGDVQPDAGGAGAAESAAESLLAAASCIDTASAGQEKLAAASQRASELNNYTDPNFMQNIQQSEMKTQEIVASAPELQHHCQCMHVYEKIAPVLDSTSIQAVPQLQPHLTKLQTEATNLQQHANQVSAGVQQVAQTCGNAATASTQSLLGVAKQVEAAEKKLLPKRRNGLD